MKDKKPISGEKISKSIRIDRNLHLMAKAKATEQDMGVEEMYAFALQRFLQADIPQKIAGAFPESAYTLSHSRWHLALEEVLNSGNARAVRAVTENLEVFVEYVRLASGPAEGGSGTHRKKRD